MQENLKAKTISGMMWSALQKFGTMGISFISNIVLARLLTPNDYGCIGMLAIFIMVSNTFVDGGLGSALIQKKEPTQKDYSGKQVEAHIARGEFAPDALVIDIVKDYIEKNNSGVGNIFDGFPRNTYQAEQFDTMLESIGSRVDVMLSLRVPDEELIKRLLLRGEVSGRADDANEEVIGNRIRIYKEQTEIVENYYSEQGKFVAIDGVGTVEEIFERLCAAIERL